MKYPIRAATNYNLRAQISTALNTIDSDVQDIIGFLKADPNILAFGVGENPGPWIIIDGATVPLINAGAAGENPPTISGNQITINSPGLYDIQAQFGIDVGSGNNGVEINIRVNGVNRGISAGSEFGGGQTAPAVQPTARDIGLYAQGDVIDFIVTETGSDTKLLLWNFSGGTCAQLQFDFNSAVPQSDPGGGGGGSVSGLPPGGVAGQILVKQSSVDGDADWDNIVFSGGGA